MGLAPPRGSTLWLLAHELRLSVRAVTARRGGLKTWIIAALVMALVAVLGGVPLAAYLSGLPSDLTPDLVARFDTALAVIFTMILSQTLSLATQAFFERGDLELLLSSPLPPRRILAARAVGIATAPFLWFTALASIPVLPLAAMGQPRWLAIYPVLGAMALLASSAGIGLTLALFRVAGARRTREIGQMLAALIGATFFLIIQARSLLPDGGERLFGGVLRWARSGVFAPDAPLAWPARAMLGEPLPLVTLVAASLLVFAAMAAGLGRRFSSNVVAAAGASTASGRISRGAVTTRRFRGGAFRAILRKEFALMRRDPTLPAQGLLRALYVAPLTFAMLKAGSGGGEADTALHLQLSALAGSVAFLAGQIAGALAWTCISAEDAPELMTCAPVEARLAQRAKLAAVLIPVALVLGAPIMVLVWLSPWIGLSALAAATGAAVSSVLINLRLEPPSQRRAFSGRPNGSALTAIAEILASMGWAVAAWMGATDTVWGLVPAAVVIGGVATLHLSPRRAR